MGAVVVVVVVELSCVTVVGCYCAHFSVDEWMKYF